MDIVDNCAGVRSCLSLYEKPSGLLINFEKYALSVSPNIEENTAFLIKFMLSIPVVQGHRCTWGYRAFYLGTKSSSFSIWLRE